VTGYPIEVCDGLNGPNDRLLPIFLGLWLIFFVVSCPYISYFF
jgi:hypothetical protein